MGKIHTHTSLVIEIASFFAFMALIILKNVGQLFYRFSLHLALSDVSSRLATGYASLARMLHK